MRIGRNDKTQIKDKKKYIGSITYMGWQTKKIIKCFEKYDMNVAVKE